MAISFTAWRCADTAFAGMFAPSPRQSPGTPPAVHSTEIYLQTAQPPTQPRVMAHRHTTQSHPNDLCKTYGDIVAGLDFQSHDASEPTMCHCAVYLHFIFKLKQSSEVVLCVASFYNFLNSFSSRCSINLKGAVCRM